MKEVMNEEMKKSGIYKRLNGNLRSFVRDIVYDEQVTWETMKTKVHKQMIILEEEEKLGQVLISGNKATLIDCCMQPVRQDWTLPKRV